ncbi:MAG: hypothetical protein JO093_24655 [Acidobacteria bacterium]|nr:hypothetical protein [Acidobacteriota bacterium]MBV9067527.1 hypothetical protein [Acidobacteriota bacterium]MBV9188820.1 hypothetical protein [Acidobacteriota bacterium]
MRKAQFVVGMVMVLAFLSSGAYMHLRLHHLHQTPDAQRMVYRASHINMLLIGALNIASSRRARSAERAAILIDRLTAMLAIAAAAFFVAAFVREPLYAHLYRPWTRVAVYCTFAAAIVDIIAIASKRVTNGTAAER